jgi:hypothetical protein
MKRCLLLVAFFVVLIIPVLAQETPHTQGLMTGTRAVGDLLADSADINPDGFTAGARRYRWVVTSDTNVNIAVEWRDSTNSNNIWSHVYPVNARQPLQVDPTVLNFNQGDRIRLRVFTTVGTSANMQGTIFTEE